MDTALLQQLPIKLQASMWAQQVQAMQLIGQLLQLTP
jgi:hypothetical protein